MDGGNKVVLNQIALRDFVENEVSFDAVLMSAEVRKQKTGGFYMTMKLMDLDRQVDVTRFNCSQTASSEFEAGKVYTMQVEVREYKKGVDGVSCIYVDSEPCVTREAKEFIKWEDGVNKALQDVLAMCERIKHTSVGRLTVTILGKYWEDFTYYPAASSFHHKYLGGLLVHTCSVAALAEQIGNFYNNWYGKETVNITLLLCGALLHDIGKLREFKFYPEAGTVEYSDESFLLNHISIGMMLIQEEATRMGLEQSKEILELQHLIASHHGRLEWGSPIEAHCIEADILSYCDQMDAVVNRRIGINKDMAYGSGATKFVGGARIMNYRVTGDDKHMEL